MTRRGVTIVELVVALFIMSILGLALTKILINDSRFVSKQDAMLSARQGARAAMNSIAAEIRMVGNGGVVTATPKLVALRVPYAFGVMLPRSITPV